MAEKIEPVEWVASFYTYERRNLPMQELKSPFRRLLEKKLRHGVRKGKQKIGGNLAER